MLDLLDAVVQKLAPHFLTAATIAVLFTVGILLYLAVTGFSSLAAHLSPSMRRARRTLRALGKDPSSQLEFLEAVSIGDLPTVDAFLASGMSPETKDSRGLPALYSAVNAGHAPVVQSLLQNGASPHTRVDDIPLIVFATHPRRLEVLTILLRAGARPNDWSGLTWRTPLIQAVYSEPPEALAVLIAAGASPDLADAEGQTALMHAAFAGRAEAARVLIHAGAPVNATDKHGGTALSAAAFQGSRATVELLIRAGADLDSKNLDGWTPLMHAAAQGHAEVMQAFLAAGADRDFKGSRGETALGLARREGHEHAVEVLRLAGALE